MNIFEKLRRLQAPADAGAGGSGSGGTSTTDAGTAGTAGESQKDAGATGGVKDGTGGTPEKKSVLKAPGDAGDGAAKKDGSDTKKGEGNQAKATDGASDKPFEVKVPEGVKLEKAKLEQFTGWAKEKGLTPEQASDALGFYAEQQKQELKAWAAQGDEWYGQLEKDPEFGKDLKASEAALQKALKRFDPKGELVADLEKYGVDNLPSLARFLRRVGLAGAEDKATVDGAKPGSDTSGKPTKGELLAARYPSLAKELAGQKT